MGRNTELVSLPLAMRMKSGSHSIPVESGCLSFDGDVRDEDRVFCVDCMSSCGHRQLGFRNHYLSRTRSPNTASFELLNKHLITSHGYMYESPPPRVICLHLLVQSKICSFNIFHRPKAADTHTVFSLRSHSKTRRGMKEKSPSPVRTEWYSRVGSGEFFLLFPMDSVFLVIRRPFLPLAFTLTLCCKWAAGIGLSTVGVLCSLRFLYHLLLFPGGRR